MRKIFFYALIFIILISPVLFVQADDVEFIETIKYYRQIEADQNMAELVLQGQTDLNSYTATIDFLSVSGLTKEQLELLHSQINHSSFQLYERNLRIIESFKALNSTADQVVVKEQLTGVWEDIPHSAAGWSRVFLFFPDGRFSFYYSQMRELPIIHSFSGRYSIQGNVLTLQTAEREIWDNREEIEYSGAFGYQWQDARIEQESFTREFELYLSSMGQFSYNIPDPGFNEFVITRNTIFIGGEPFFKKSDNPQSYP